MITKDIFGDQGDSKNLHPCHLDSIWEILKKSEIIVVSENQNKIAGLRTVDEHGSWKSPLGEPIIVHFKREDVLYYEIEVTKMIHDELEISVGDLGASSAADKHKITRDEWKANPTRRYFLLGKGFTITGASEGQWWTKFTDYFHGY